MDTLPSESVFPLGKRRLCPPQTLKRKEGQNVPFASNYTSFLSFPLKHLTLNKVILFGEEMAYIKRALSSAFCNHLFFFPLWIGTKFACLSHEVFGWYRRLCKQLFQCPVNWRIWKYFSGNICIQNKKITSIFFKAKLRMKKKFTSENESKLF